MIVTPIPYTSLKEFHFLTFWSLLSDSLLNLLYCFLSFFRFCNCIHLVDKTIISHTLGIVLFRYNWFTALAIERGLLLVLIILDVKYEDHSFHVLEYFWRNKEKLIYWAIPHLQNKTIIHELLMIYLFNRRVFPWIHHWIILIIWENKHIKSMLSSIDTSHQ